MVAGLNPPHWFVDPRLMTAELSQADVALREYFIEEYTKDSNSYAACLRIGFQPSFAVEYAKKLMDDPYVVRRLSELNSQIDSPDSVERDKMLIINALRESIQFGDYKTRVTAAKELSELRGIKNSKDVSTDSILVDAFKNFAKTVSA